MYQTHWIIYLCLWWLALERYPWWQKNTNPIFHNYPNPYLMGQVGMNEFIWTYKFYIPYFYLKWGTQSISQWIALIFLLPIQLPGLKSMPLLNLCHIIHPIYNKIAHLLHDKTQWINHNSLDPGRKIIF